MPRNDTTDCQSLFKLKMRGNSILRSVIYYLSELDHMRSFGEDRYQVTLNKTPRCAE